MIGWWVFGATVLAGLVLRPLIGDRVFVARYTGYVMPWLLVLLVPGAARAWAGRHFALAAVLTASAAIVVAVHAPLFRRLPAVAPPPGLALRAMTYNTWGRNEDADRIAGVVLRSRPDVLLLQETEPAVLVRVVEALGTLYGGAPVHLAHEPALRQAVLSRYPVASSAGLPRKGKAQKVVLRSPAGPVTVFNVHPLRIGGWHRRYSQIAALLRDDLAREPGPVILGGDLNAPPHSELHGLVARALADVHAARGSGFGFTYPAALSSPLGVLPAVPVVRIDHLFVSRHFVTLAAATLDDAGGSDHRPVTAELVLAAPLREAHPPPAGVAPAARDLVPHASPSSPTQVREPSG